MILETINLTKKYGPKVGCAEICLSVDQGQIFGFLGPNGAGKSTLVKMLVGLLNPTAGSGKILGYPLGSLEVRRKLGFLPENFRYQPWLTGEELLSFHASLSKLPPVQKRARIPLVLNQVGLAGKGDQKIGSYSKGMQQRIGLACALLADPEILFLDEPSSALDPLGRREVRQIMLELRDRGKTVFLNSHLLSEVEMICDRVEIIQNGHIILGGTLEELLTKTTEVEMVVEGMTDALFRELSDLSQSIQLNGQHLELTLKKRSDIPRLADKVIEHSGHLYSLTSRHTSLEDLYVSLIQGRGKNPC
ncbi:MAG: ABC transporter ATP-binding protein [Desulfosporosinus sp.]|nr:ABC transporter ATP-binding protein [Desulfosporosinus sp.]